MVAVRPSLIKLWCWSGRGIKAKPSRAYNNPLKWNNDAITFERTEKKYVSGWQCNPIAMALWINEQAKRTMVWGGRKLGRNFKFLNSPAREKCEAYNSIKPENFFCRTDPHIWFLGWHHCGKPDYNKGTYWSCQAHKLEPPQLPKPTKLGRIVHSHCIHHLIPSYWQFSIVDGKTHCALNCGTYHHLSY